MENVFKRLSNWWEGGNLGRPAILFSIPKPNKKIFLVDPFYVNNSRNPDITIIDLNKYWTSTKSEPDFDGLIEVVREDINTNYYFGEAVPFMYHQWGRRGTPMTMAAYLGGKVKFLDDTVWVNPVIDDYRKFELHLDENNIWLKRSLELFEKAVEKSNGEYLPALPDFGDALTVLSLLRGTERLLMDLIENKEAVLEFRNRFTELFPRFHKKFWDIFRQKFPGDISWRVWTPGKTYLCQCDFSTMIPPEMFEEFVVPEIEVLGKYLDYCVWHLDGPDEIRHLDILLDLPEIKAIQWQPGAGAPPAASPQWLPMLKKIQKKGKNLTVYANNEEELRILLKELSSKGLLIIVRGFTGKTEKEALELMDMISKLSKR
ncbi:MAG: hypothetical protein ABIK53_07275 [bacterium]